MKEVIIQNLKIRFDALKKHKDDPFGFLHFCIDYIDFVLNNDELVPIIRGLIDEGKLYPTLLQQIYNDYMVIPGAYHRYSIGEDGHSANFPVLLARSLHPDDFHKMRSMM